MRLSHIGGHPALDSVNTVHGRLDPARRHDRLATWDDAVEWCQEASLLDTAEGTRVLDAVGRRPRRTAAELERLCDLRQDLCRCSATMTTTPRLPSQPTPVSPRAATAAGAPPEDCGTATAHAATTGKARSL